MTANAINSLALESLQILPYEDLVQIAEQKLNLGSCELQTRQDIIFKIISHLAEHGEKFVGKGVLELTPDGYGFLRKQHCSYLPSNDDVYLSPKQIRRFNLRTGDEVEGQVRPPKDGERYLSLTQISSVNGIHVDNIQKRMFENLTPIYAHELLQMECDKENKKDCTGRLIDFFSPIGKGQRALIVAPPKAGKTEIIKNIAHAISVNNPEAVLLVLLIDERPEEVTEMMRFVKGEVIASTFDEPANRHVQVAEMTIERAKRLVEDRRDVIILLDSITRLARAYNSVQPSSGRILSGGLDANAMQRPKRFFGAARNLEEGGSLTIIATALIDTGSKMDDVIYEEFKGTGNMELHLSRNLAEMRLFPAINIKPSSTRKDDYLLDEKQLNVQWEVRKELAQLDEDQALKYMLDLFAGSKTNKTLYTKLHSELKKK